MRSDYALYGVAIIFFLLTTIVLAYPMELRDLWIVTTAVLGLLFVGLGYTQKPKPRAITVQASAPAPAAAPVMPQSAAATEVVKEEKPEIVAKVEPPKKGLTEIRGINEKRAEQLKTLGINTIADLAKIAPKDLAAKMNLSPKITAMWIGQAKKISEKS
jgi:predicted flap endonuclease-1-like 5' DNA nuclease